VDSLCRTVNCLDRTAVSQDAQYLDCSSRVSGAGETHCPKSYMAVG
jgi:hypothetical protein